MSQAKAFVVSVVIPVYNAEKFVARAVESALAQPEVGEIVLVEDDSPDRALAVCQQLETRHPDKVHLFRHTDGQNHGAGPSRNLGIHHARFPFIAFLDADDYYLPNRFKHDAELLMGDETLDGAYNALGVDFIDEKGKQWWHADPNRSNLTTILDPPPPEKLFEEMSLIGKRGFFHFDTLTVRRRTFDRAGWFTDLRRGEDTLLRMQMAALCRLAGGQTREPVAMRGVHGENTIREPDHQHRAELAVFEALLAWVPSANVSRRQREALHYAYIRRFRDLSALRRGLAKHPDVILHARTCSAMVRLCWRKSLAYVRRLIFRRSPEDPYLPGLFPGLRGNNAKHRSRSN